MAFNKIDLLCTDTFESSSSFTRMQFSTSLFISLNKTLISSFDNSLAFSSSTIFAWDSGMSTQRTSKTQKTAKIDDKSLRIQINFISACRFVRIVGPNLLHSENWNLSAFSYKSLTTSFVNRIWVDVLTVQSLKLLCEQPARSCKVEIAQEWRVKKKWGCPDRIVQLDMSD